MMISRKLPATMVAAAMLSCVGWNVASAQTAPGNTPAFVGKVYTLHTPASSDGCPSLDWHIVVGQNNTLSGMIGADDMEIVFRVHGTYDPALKTFRLDGTEVSGPHVGAPGAINGAFEPTTYRMAATLGGLPVGAKCQGKTVYIKWMDSVAVGGGM
jgi:hypothetical protein